MSDQSPSTNAALLAVLVAALLFLSAVAIPLAGATPAATPATEPDVSPTGSDASGVGALGDVEHAAQVASPAVERGGVDAALRSGGLYFAGQRLGLAVPDAVTDADAVELRRYDRGDDRAGTFVREYDLGTERSLTLSTDRLRGEYVLVPAGDRSQVLRFGTDGVATGLVAAGDARPVEVTEQSLRVEWGQDRITTGDDDVDLEIRSNRARYNLNVSADGLDYDDLESLFRTGGAASNPDPYTDRQPFAVGGVVHDAHAAEDVLVIRGLRDGSLSADFTTIDPGTYRFAFEVTDTGVTSGAPVGDDDEGPPAVEPDPAFFALTDLDPETATVAPGESLVVSVTVRNLGGVAGTQVVSLRVDGDPVADREVTLDRDATERVSLTLDAPDDPGTYAHSVHTANASIAGSVVVEAPATPTPEPDTPTETPTETPTPEPDTPAETPASDDDAPGFGVVAALVALAALLGTASIAARRR